LISTYVVEKVCKEENITKKEKVRAVKARRIKDFADEGSAE
jgi:hypothetical protein